MKFRCRACYDKLIKKLIPEKAREVSIFDTHAAPISYEKFLDNPRAALQLKPVKCSRCKSSNIEYV